MRHPVYGDGPGPGPLPYFDSPKDTDSDGQLSYDEIVALRSGFYFLNPEGSVDDVFIVLDEDHNDRIDKGNIAVGILSQELLMQFPKDKV